MFGKNVSKIRVLLLPAFLFHAAALFAQTTLTADGQTDTYALIASVLGGNPIESPDCSDPDFGPHITQEFDSDLGKFIFAFYIHVTPDNDRCVAFDRQRNEIKTYGPSPAYLKGFYGDTVTFRWRFKLDAGFQPSPSFTHIHQIKAGDGDGAAPIITLTPRAGNPDRLQVIHVDSQGATSIIASTELSPLEGGWVEAYERISYGFNGTYSIRLTRVNDGAVLLFFSSDNIDLWRIGTTFVRPKWGIYRSLHNQNYLRDERVGFDSFCLAKGSDDCPALVAAQTAQMVIESLDGSVTPLPNGIYDSLGTPIVPSSLYLNNCASGWGMQRWRTSATARRIWILAIQAKPTASAGRGSPALVETKRPETRAFRWR